MRLRSFLRPLVPTRWRSQQIVDRFVLEQSGGRVVAGPFANMLFTVDTTAAPLVVPKLLGTFEQELHGWLGRILEGEILRIVNVGAAEGYYSVGLARAKPGARVISYEADPRLRATLLEIANRNGVANRVDVHGLCDGCALQESLKEKGRQLVLMDIEGGEAVLLDPRLVAALKECEVIVELHEFVFPEIHQVIEARFVETHEIHEVVQQPRRRADFPLRPPRWMDSALSEAIVNAMHEHRPARMRWLVMAPRA